jgi:hypothetical protein
MTKIRFLVAILTTAILASIALSAETQERKPSEPVLTSTERIVGLETIYRVAKQCFAGFERVPNLDWDKAFAEFIPQVEEEQDIADYYQTLQRFIALLQDGHCDVFLSDSLRKRVGCLPVRLGFLKNEVVVIERRPTPEIVEEDIPPGTVVETIEGEPGLEFLTREYGPYLGTSRPEIMLQKTGYVQIIPTETKLHFGLRYPDGQQRDREIVPFTGKLGLRWSKETLEKYVLPWHRVKNSLQSDILDQGILYVRYPSCNSSCEQSLCKLIEQHKENPPKALIIDFRGNGGGNTPEQAIGHLISAPLKYFVCRTRCSIGYTDANTPPEGTNALSGTLTLNREGMPPLELAGNWLTTTWIIQPADIHYDGPLFLLTNAETASAAEDFVGPLQASGRATVIGEATAGSSGQPIMVDLPGGGRFRICTLDLQYPEGGSFIGKGIQPDVPVQQTIKGVAEGKDEVMDEALKYVRQQIKKGP